VSTDRDAFEGERQRVQAILREMTAAADRACGIPVDTPDAA
jgi:hypothetical protein